MSIRFHGAPADNLPLVLPWTVDGEKVEVTIMASANTIHVAKIMQYFKQERVFPDGQPSRKMVARDVLSQLAKYLSAQDDFGILKHKYSFSVEELLEL